MCIVEELETKIGWSAKVKIKNLRCKFTKRKRQMHQYIKRNNMAKCTTCQNKDGYLIEKHTNGSEKHRNKQC